MRILREKGSKSVGEKVLRKCERKKDVRCGVIKKIDKGLKKKGLGEMVGKMIVKEEKLIIDDKNEVKVDEVVCREKIGKRFLRKLKNGEKVRKKMEKLLRGEKWRIRMKRRKLIMKKRDDIIGEWGRIVRLECCERNRIDEGIGIEVDGKDFKKIVEEESLNSMDVDMIFIEDKVFKMREKN